MLCILFVYGVYSIELLLHIVYVMLACVDLCFINQGLSIYNFFKKLVKPSPSAEALYMADVNESEGQERRMWDDEKQCVTKCSKTKKCVLNCNGNSWI